MGVEEEEEEVVEVTIINVEVITNNEIMTKEAVDTTISEEVMNSEEINAAVEGETVAITHPVTRDPETINCCH